MMMIMKFLKNVGLFKDLLKYYGEDAHDEEWLAMSIIKMTDSLK